MITKKIVLVLMMVFLNGLNAYAELPDSFRGLKFGQPPDKRLKLADRDGLVDTYLDPRGVMAINNVKASAINYYFFKNKFYMVFVQGAEEDSGNMLEQLIALFGAPREGAKDGSYMWSNGDRIAIFKPIVIEESTGKSTCGFVLYKGSLRKELDASQTH